MVQALVVVVGGEGRGGWDSHIKRRGLLIRKFEKNP